jgi:hypothetical protein
MMLLTGNNDCMIPISFLKFKNSTFLRSTCYFFGREVVAKK